MEKQRTKKKKIILRVVIIILAALVVLDFGITYWAYHQNFDRTFTSYEPLMLRVEDFPGLSRTRYEFTSDKGQTLAGYLYKYGDGSSRKAVVVLAHGLGGGGHNSYMDVADCFAENGCYVFAYDATGSDESAGSVMGGMPQGIADLDSAISFVEELPECQGLPVLLFGHSWGAYCAMNVLPDHPEVKGVIECCGFDTSLSMFEAAGKEEAGPLIYTMRPWFSIIDRVRFGELASRSAVESMADAQDTKFFCVAAENDEMVPDKYGYSRFYDAFQDDGRFTFLKVSDKTHDTVYSDRTYREEFDAEFVEWLKGQGYDPTAPENEERFNKDRVDYINEHLDRERWSHSLDSEVFRQFLSFYDTCL